MVRETIMNRCNGSTQSPPSGVAKGMGELTHDIVSLVELQFELFRVDCREGLRRILIPVVLLLFAGIVAVGTVPRVTIPANSSSATGISICLRPSRQSIRNSSN